MPTYLPSPPEDADRQGQLGNPEWPSRHEQFGTSSPSNLQRSGICFGLPVLSLELQCQSDLITPIELAEPLAAINHQLAPFPRGLPARQLFRLRYSLPCYRCGDNLVISMSVPAILQRHHLLRSYMYLCKCARYCVGMHALSAPLTRV